MEFLLEEDAAEEALVPVPGITHFPSDMQSQGKEQGVVSNICEKERERERSYIEKDTHISYFW